MIGYVSPAITYNTGYVRIQQYKKPELECARYLCMTHNQLFCWMAFPIVYYDWGNWHGHNHFENSLFPFKTNAVMKTVEFEVLEQYEQEFLRIEFGFIAFEGNPMRIMRCGNMIGFWFNEPTGASWPCFLA